MDYGGVPEPEYRESCMSTREEGYGETWDAMREKLLKIYREYSLQSAHNLSSLFRFLHCSRSLAMPKSAIFECNSSSSKMLLSLRSRCMILSLESS
ncbi:unnamed protein product [Rhodiola kirilowii]